MDDDRLPGQAPVAPDENSTAAPGEPAPRPEDAAYFWAAQEAAVWQAAPAAEEAPAPEEIPGPQAAPASAQAAAPDVPLPPAQAEALPETPIPLAPDTPPPAPTVPPAGPAGKPAPRPGALSVAQCLAILAPGLLPVIGIVACVLWGFGPQVPAQKQNLARALLWVHAAALLLVIAGLCVWVFGLARTHGLL